ncbi:MAG: N-acetyltransferase [Oscillospiraceae bacterium]|nr:N-acetyltransferase [Oscillospiraceae bacterium]
MKYRVIQLQQLIDDLGEDVAQALLSSFSCPRNKDIEGFLREKAILANRQRITMTHLVFEQGENGFLLVAYFALANKILSGVKGGFPRKLWDRIKRFAILADNRYQVPSVLIAQLGKNYTNGLNERISGVDLLSLAMGEVRSAQMIVGGKTTYLECEDAPKLRAFYEKNGFVYIGQRQTEGDDSRLLLQYLGWID